MAVSKELYLALIEDAKANGGIPLCGKCDKPASLAMFCPDGTVQGVGCIDCAVAHQTQIQVGFIFWASDMALEPECSCCGDEHPTEKHIQVEWI